MRTAIRLAVGLAALAGSTGESGAAPATCDLVVSVSPPTSVTGSRKVQIHVPPGRADVRFRASSGTTGAALRAGADLLVTEFTPALERPPVALIAAVGGNLCGFTVVRMAGAQALPVTGPSAALAVVEPAALPADREGGALVYVFAVDGNGQPRRGAAPSLRPSAGSVSGLEPLAPGAWRARWKVPALEASSVRLEAVFGKEPPAVATLERTPGPPAAIEITRDSGAAASGDVPSAVLVRVRDSAGNLTEAPVEVEADGVKLGKSVRLEVGLHRVPLLVPPGLREQTFVISARTAGITGQATFSTAYSAAAEVRVAPRGPIRADASVRGQFEVLEVAVVDAAGNPVSDAPVGSGGGGYFREAFPVGPGRWALPYRPPQISEDASEQVVVTAGAASTTVELELVARRLSLSVGMKAGLAVAGGGNGLGVGAEGGAWTPLGRSRLGLVLGVDWWMLSRNSTATVGAIASTYQATQQYPSLLLSAAWRTPAAGRWMLGASAGAGGGVVSNRAQLAGQPAVSETGFAPLVSGAVSAIPRLGPGALFIELRATWVGDPGLSTLSGSSTTFLGLVGYRFDVG